MHLAELKAKSPADLLVHRRVAEHRERLVSLRKQDMMFTILKNAGRQRPGDPRRRHAGDPVGRVRLPAQPRRANYLPGPDDIYISPTQVRRFALRTGDTRGGSDSCPQGWRTLLRAC